VTGQSVAGPLLREVPVLSGDDTVRAAVRHLLDAHVTALPVADDQGRFAGIFGEREFITAIFPGYLRELKGAHFIRRALDADLNRRRACLDEPVARHAFTEHVDVGADFSDAELAEIFLHHRVSVIPVLDENRRVMGIITRRDFFRAVAERVLAD
jgi:CBS-domain-containing membrane protein